MERLRRCPNLSIFVSFQVQILKSVKVFRHIEP
jgi:hypothetical protein